MQDIIKIISIHSVRIFTRVIYTIQRIVII